VESGHGHGRPIRQGWIRGRSWLGTLFLLATTTTLVTLAPEVSAYELYSGSDRDTTTGSCANCHGEFNGPDYISLMDSSNWNANLMAGHTDSVMGASDCNVCHGSGKKAGNTFLNTSSGGVGLPAIGCVGCHGRAEDDVPGNPEPAGSGTGAGLRQLHFNANLGGFTDENSNPITTQICADCHADANPASYTPVGENVLPPYYPLVDVSPVDGVDDNFPLKPIDSCNGAPAPHNENKFGAFGLDHDGDGLVDSNDPDCAGNIPPVANDDSDTVAEGGSVPIDVVANDTDADGTVDATTVTIVTDVTNGSTAVNPTTGVVTYTHDGSETTSDSFTYTVQDNNGATSNTATVSITVTPVNDPPVANDDSDTVAEGGSVPIDVLANDTDADGTVDATTVTIVTDVTNGSTAVNPTTGVVTYTHDGSETTSDSFTYTVQDNLGATSNTATVTITVTPVNDPPVANDDSDTVAEGNSVVIAVLANDTDADGTLNPATVSATNGTNGTTSVNTSTGEVTYTHDGSETTSDSFTYTVQDNNGATSNIATVSITVTPVNDPPVANDDSDTVAEGNSVVIAVLANDTDADGTVDATTVTIVTDVTNGSTVVNPTNGVVTYTHDGSATTSDSFTYTVQDNNGATSNTATVNITVTEANDPPVANDDSDTVAEGGSVPIDVLANDTDADGTVDATTVTIVTDVTNGSTSVNPTTGVVTYTHDGSETLSDSFTYTVQDNNGATSNTATVTITVTPVNDPPVANDDSDTVAEGDSVVIAVLANDTDADGTLNPATVSATNGTNGTTSVNTSTGEVTYTHDGSATTSDSFTYTVQDNLGATSNTATVNITVTPVNDPPVANDDSDTVAEGDSVDIDVVANDTDVDGTVDATTVTIITDVTNGSTAVNPTTGVVTYTHDGSETTSDSFTYTVNDDQAATSNTATVNITVTPVNDPPVANDDFDNVAEGGSVPIAVVANDTDADGSVDATTVTIVTDVTNGSTVVNPTTGVVTYTHDGSATTSDSFTYTVDDDQAATSNLATVTITVTAIGPSQAIGLWFHNIGSTAMTLFWSEGIGDGSIVVMKQGSAVNATPTDGTEHLADRVFGSGADLGGGNFVVYRGNGESVHVTGLTSLQTYHVAVFTYTGAGALIEYLLPDPAIGNETTTDYTPHNVAVLNVDDTVTCTTGCHGGHGNALVPRGADQETACVSCHSPDSGVPGASALTNFSLHTNSKGNPPSSPGVVDCGSCHELHNPGVNDTTYSQHPITSLWDYNLHYLRAHGGAF
jgi:hypothetical protein